MSDPATDPSLRIVELRELPVPAMFFRLLSSRFTGVAGIRQDGPHEGDRSIHFRGGMPVFTDWQQEGSRLGELAVAQNLASSATLDRAIAAQAETPKAIGELLREIAGVDQNRILGLLRMQTTRRLIDLFGVAEGVVLLTTNDGIDEELFQVNVLELVHRGVTARYDVGRIRREMGDAAGLPLHATAAFERYVEQFRFRPDDASLVGYLGTGAPASLAELSRMPDVDPQRAAQVVHVLWTCRMIEAATVPRRAAVQATGDSAGFLAALAELEQRIASGTEPAAVLELERDADAQAIDDAWQTLSRRFHPDAVPRDADEQVRERVRVIVRALDSVRASARRRRHALAEIAGLRMVRDGKYVRGLAMLQEAKALGSVGAEVEAALVWAKLHTGARTPADVKTTDAALAAIVAANPELSEAVYYQASVATMLGRTDEAIAGFETVLRVQPDHLDAQRQLRALRRGERGADAKSSAKSESRTDGGREFTPFEVTDVPRHPLLTSRMKTLYWIAGFVLALLVLVNVVLRLDMDF